MAMRVAFTPLAERQLQALHRYIAERSGIDRADDYVGRIVTFCQNLGTFPIRGRSRDDLLPGLRTIGFERRATIAFMVELIEGIYYGGQDYEATFAV
ncbi:MAG: type II toxin-antitoxin system RelE/ParE family toxin [Beijerinckiaceae bacterium]|nr:type II toxin-antitoxin system RelE/ParE family toxin [Beijerinckiaceae bacterium]